MVCAFGGALALGGVSAIRFCRGDARLAAATAAAGRPCAGARSLLLAGSGLLLMLASRAGPISRCSMPPNMRFRRGADGLFLTRAEIATLRRCPRLRPSAIASRRSG